jgi:hypothetical protein
MSDEDKTYLFGYPLILDTEYGPIDVPITIDEFGFRDPLVDVDGLHKRIEEAFLRGDQRIPEPVEATLESTEITPGIFISVNVFRGDLDE